MCAALWFFTTACEAGSETPAGGRPPRDLTAQAGTGQHPQALSGLTVAEDFTPSVSGNNGAITASRPFRVLQLNLCNSGYAGCYRGGASISEAVTQINSRVPDVVTLNEI